AIAAGFADFILSPEAMPEEIINYVKERPYKKLFNGKLDEQALPEVLNLIEKHCGYDFHNYKTPTIIRRIARRMNQLSKKKFDEYLDHLRQHGEECKILGKEFLIGVTKFFRDTTAFEIFKNEVVSEVVRTKENHDTLKVWITACSTGQEAYSIAILINEALHQIGKTLDVKIFATDIDADAIEFASKGVYSISALQKLNEEWVNRYFIRQEDKIVVVPHIRKQIVFARHNILKDPPFIKNDIVTCRNMLIYMNNVLQRKVLQALQYSLNVGGFLFLGPSEIPGSISHLLTEVNNKWKIYRKTGVEHAYQPMRYDSVQGLRNNRDVKEPAAKEGYMAKGLSEEMKNLLTEEFRFAAIYIDTNYEIKEAVGDFRHYLSLPQKIINLNVLKMVNQDMTVALNTAIRKATKENKKITLNNIRIREEGKEKFINLYVKPAQAKEGYLMIVFGEGNEVTLAKPSNENLHFQTSDTASYINELEEELKATKGHLQMVVESLETTNEELQSSNEELLSANEELQSSNEELQSLNEELHTLNTEHQLRIKELIELNDDLNNYFQSTEMGQVFVDANYRIRKFNPATAHFINLIETDIGRPIEHISTNIRDENLLKNIQLVETKGIPIEKEVVLHDRTISLMRILPYVRQDKKIDGVVITFYDITALTELNNIIKGVFNASLSAIMAFKSVRDEQNKIDDFTWIASNYASDQFLGKNNAEYVGKSLKKEYPELLKNGFFEQCVDVVSTGKAWHTEMIFEKEGEEQWYEVVATKMMDGLVITLTNINEKKEAEQKLHSSYKELIKTKENLKNLNASLEDKVAQRTKELAKSEERFRLIADATSDVVWDWNLVTNEIWWSESFYKLFGFDHKNSMVETSTFWMESIHPDDKEQVYESIHNAINDASTNWSAQYRFRKQDGSYAIIQDKGAVITDEQGVPYRMVGAMTDITEVERTEKKLEQKNSELQALIQEFQFVTDFMPQMVWATQPDGYHDFYNKRWYDYTGLNYEQTKDKGWSLVLHPDDYNRTWEVWRHSLATGDKYEVEYRMRGHDGTYRWFLGRAIPLRDEAGNIIKWFGTCTDIHEQKMMNDVLEQKVMERTSALEKTNKELEKSNNELLQFASVASHDLKEPLRKIHLFSNLLKERYL
ncbi:MAG: PAS domain-containing protein, partial [Flavisolibacter sp.]|nr:PAS domain-containing protein [Flavisolibacter sp.]